MLRWCSVLLAVFCLVPRCAAQDERGATVEEPKVTSEERGKPKPKRDSVTLRGVVSELHRSPGGDLDGLMLGNETTVRLPPHLGESVAKAVAAGNEIEVTGRRHTGPKGDSHIRAEVIRNLSSGVSVRLDSPPPAPRQKTAEEATSGRGLPPHEQILGEIRSLRAFVDGNVDSQGDDQSFAGPHHEQILSELRELRTALEKRWQKDDKPRAPKKKKPSTGDTR